MVTGARALLLSISNYKDEKLYRVLLHLNHYAFLPGYREALKTLSLIQTLKAFYLL